jgi:hypothetical protein
MLSDVAAMSACGPSSGPALVEAYLSWEPRNQREFELPNYWHTGLTLARQRP